jgi:hypothetical protein
LPRRLGGREDRDLLALPLEGRRWSILERRRRAVRESGSRVLGDQHRVAGLPRRGLDASGDVHGVADHRELEAARAADVPCDHASGVETHADRELAGELIVDGALDLDRGRERLVGVFGPSARCSGEL